MIQRALVIQSQNGHLTTDNFKLTPTGLTVVGKPDFEQWQQFGVDFLFKAERATQWWIGDWLRYGELRWGEMYAQAIDETGLDYGTLRDYKWIAEHVELSFRNDNLSFTHHRVIAHLDAKQQRKYLKIAEKENLSISKLRQRILLDELEQAANGGERADIPDDVTLLHGDFLDCIKNLPDDSTPLIFTDPPYDEGSIPFYGALAQEAARILKPGGSLIAYAGHYALPRILSDMNQYLRYWWMLALEHGGQSARLPGKWVMVEWKPLVWYVKLRRSSNEYVADLFKSHQPSKTEHECQQDTSEADYYIERLTQPGDLVVDPFVGSGTTLVAALESGRRAWGCDSDKTAIRISRNRLSSYL